MNAYDQGKNNRGSALSWLMYLMNFEPKWKFKGKIEKSWIFEMNFLQLEVKINQSKLMSINSMEKKLLFVNIQWRLK